ncbi:MAG: radical SAM protein [Bacteroidetes bacterium]|nr:radical SAM protein [Bacteroidota bacterium]
MKNNKPTLGKRITLNVFNKYVNAQSQLHDLSYLFWECTLRCNINCLHCGSDCHKNSEVKDMPAADFLEITKQISTKYNPNKAMVVITGGEPLMRKDLEKVGLALYHQGYPWGFVTNGYMLNQVRFRNLINFGLRSITLSLDGFEESHDWLRGKEGSYKKALSALKFITSEKDLVYDVVTCVNQKNIGELGELKNWLIRNNVKKWRLFTISPIGRAFAEPLLDISDKQMLQLMDFIKETRKEGLIQASYGCEGYLGNYEKEVRDGFYFCRAGVNIASVLADGSIGACPNINHSFVQGNIYQHNFLEIWDTKFQKYRDRSWTKKGKCANCDSFKWCHGNGMHLQDPEQEDVLRCHHEMICSAYDKN